MNKIGAYDAPSGNPNLEALQYLQDNWTPDFIASAKQTIALLVGGIPLTSLAGNLFATITVAAAAGTVRNIYGLIATPVTAMTSGTITGVRGECSVVATCAVSGTSFLYGAQGKLVMGAGSSLAIGSGYACGVLGQIDISNGTTTSGHIAAVIANIQDSSNTARAYVDCIYAETPLFGSGEVVNSVLKAIGSFTQVFDLTGAHADALFSIPASSAGAKVDADIAYAHYKKMPVVCDGVTGWILIGLDA